jgi:hypothetical protein
VSKSHLVDLPVLGELFQELKEDHLISFFFFIFFLLALALDTATQTITDLVSFSFC